MSEVREYRVEGMHCASCVEKVTSALEGAPGVRDAEVSLGQRSARVEVEDDASDEPLREAVASAGDYELAQPNGRASMAPEDEEGSEESLYPLLLIVGYLIGVVVLIAWATGEWAPMTMMRWFMGGFFLTFSFFKLLDLHGFVTAYRGYDLLAKRSRGWAYAYPFVELALGALYVLALWPVWINSFTLAIMLIGAIGVLRALLDKRRIQCACLGTALNLPMTKVTLIEDLTMAAMAAAMLAWTLT